MIDFCLRRDRASDRVRASVTLWVGHLEKLESRIALTNGLVGVPGHFNVPPNHLFSVTSIPQDPNNTGQVPSTSLTIVGQTENPAGGDISAVHTVLQIEVLENGAVVGSVSWDTRQTGPPEFHQDPTAPNRALFSIPVVLQSSGSDPQNVTFRVTAVGFGTVPVVRVDNQQPLTGTFMVSQAPAGLTISQISPITSPRSDPVSTVDVTFSQAINPTTFTAADLTLTRDGTAVPLGSEVTFTTGNNTTFTVGGLAGSTTAPGAYVLTVNASGVMDPAGMAGSGSQSVSFTVESANAPPTIARFSPITSPRTTPVSAIGVTFSKAINPATFTVADLNLTREGAPVLLGSDVTFTTNDNITFSIGNLTSYTTPPGAYALTVNAAGVTDLAGNPGTGTQAINFTVQAPVVDTGPQVVGLRRFGVHELPTLLVMTFDRQLNRTRAGNQKNYLVLNPGRDGRVGTADDIKVPLFSGFYNSANKTVTLVTAKPISLFKLHGLVARGTGPVALTDLNGIPLDGQSNGMPGTDFTTVFSREILSVTVPTRRTTDSQSSPVRASGSGRFRHFQIGST